MDSTGVLEREPSTAVGMYHISMNTEWVVLQLAGCPRHWDKYFTPHAPHSQSSHLPVGRQPSSPAPAVQSLKQISSRLLSFVGANSVFFIYLFIFLSWQPLQQMMSDYVNITHHREKILAETFACGHSKHFVVVSLPTPAPPYFSVCIELEFA